MADAVPNPRSEFFVLYPEWSSEEAWRRFKAERQNGQTFPDWILAKKNWEAADG